MYFKIESLFSNPVARIENVDVLLKIINSCVMDYYIQKTSVSIDGGYPCYQKNFIERFTIPQITDKQISELRSMSNADDINKYVCSLYHINLPAPKRVS